MRLSYRCSECGAAASGGSSPDDHLYCSAHPKALIHSIVSRSGPTLTEARRAELGQRRLQLRIGERALSRLDALCEASGFSRSEQVEALIDVETELGSRNQIRTPNPCCV